MNAAEPQTRYLYWVTADAFEFVKNRLLADGFEIGGTLMTPCQVLKAHDNKLVFAPPKIWSGMCKRQGSWYRDSERNGSYMIMAAQSLPPFMDVYFDAELSVSDFMPDRLPTDAELQEVVDSDAYQSTKPAEWEGIGLKDAVMFKIMFGLTRFWKRGDTLRKHWIAHKANHANFLAHKFTTEVDGESVPYSLTENARVCSSCAEFFNVVEPESRKLVRACPGSITISGASRDIFYDVKPARPNR